eukprot:EG_transcript_15881
MGTCATTASIPEQPLSLTPEEESKAYDTIFTAIVNAALDMLEIEIITRQALSPPCPEIMQGLCAVAVIDIAANQVNNPNGIVIVPGSGGTLTKSNCPLWLKGLVEPLITMKDELAKVNAQRELSTGDLNRVKQVMLFAFTDSPVRVWGSSLQRYETVLDFANRASHAAKQLPQYETRSAAAAEEIQASVQNQVFQVRKKPPKSSNAADAQDPEEEEDEGDAKKVSPIKPPKALPPAAPPAAVGAENGDGKPPPPDSPLSNGAAKATHIKAMMKEELEDVEDE